jgi:hypothetical protein
MIDEQPQPNITDPSFKWVRPEHTNVQETWRKFGWQPPSETKKEKEAA